MKEFVSHLKKVLHLSTPGALVIWWVDQKFFFVLFVYHFVLITFCRYDSVTVRGNLQWQDQLTELNKPFFDLCDGIFMNYTWKVCLWVWSISRVSVSSICLVLLLVSNDVSGELPKPISWSCWGQKIRCLHGNWCFWAGLFWWWAMDCMSQPLFNICFSIGVEYKTMIYT